MQSPIVWSLPCLEQQQFRHDVSSSITSLSRDAAVNVFPNQFDLFQQSLRQLKPFADAAERAKNGEIYFGITHSAIDPKTYASTSATADYLVNSVGASWVARDAQKDAPNYLRLESMKGAVPPRLEKTMEPTREARIGSFHVLGYRGETKEHHMAHLFQMGATLLPELVARWR